MKNNKSNISSKSSMGKYRRRGFTACCILILCLCCFTSTAFATSGSIDDDQLRLESLKVGDITEHGIVTAIDENGYFFKIDESEAVVTPMSTFNGSLTGLFDSETTLNDSAFYFGGQAVSRRTVMKMTHNGVRSYCRTGLRFVMNLQKNIQEAMIMAALNKKSVDDINVKGQRVLVRCDFNVPLIDGKITDENRIVAALPTIKKLIADGGKVILCSHLGKPKGEPKPELSLAPVAVRLAELLGQDVKFAADPEVVGENAKAAVEAMKDGDVVLLENTRYRAEETKNGEAFSKELASLCDVFVNDAFGTAHRAHCSNVGVTEYVDTAVVGYLMQKEIDFLGNAVENPERPFVAILGGAKVSSKISVINNLLDKVDTLIIGGGMSYTFTKAQGGSVGASLLEEDYLQYALDMIKKAEEKGVKLLLPVDTIVADEFSNDANTKVVSRDAIPDGWMGLDIGPETAKIFAEAVKSAKTVVWNGPMGCFEMPKFAEGTKVVAEALANTEAVTIIGGGDSAAAVNQLGFGDKMTHISTGGGASLEFLEGKELPGVAAANDK